MIITSFIECDAPTRSLTADLLITNQQANKLSFH